MPERKRRGVWKTALKALGAAVGVAVLLVLCGFVLASPQVWHSRLGKRMEHRFPIRWSEVALVFGNEVARSEAVFRLTRTGSRRAIPPLVRATRDRSPSVSILALNGLWQIAGVAPREAERAIVGACEDREPRVRAHAYRCLPAGPYHAGLLDFSGGNSANDVYYAYRPGSAKMSPTGQGALARGLRDPDAECQWAALHIAFVLYVEGEASPELREALQNRLLSPPPSHWVPGPGSAKGLLRDKQFSTLMRLWMRNRRESRAQLREYLRKHPLTAERRPGQ